MLYKYFVLIFLNSMHSLKVLLLNEKNDEPVKVVALHFLASAGGLGLGFLAIQLYQVKIISY